MKIKTITLDNLSQDFIIGDKIKTNFETINGEFRIDVTNTSRNNSKFYISNNFVFIIFDFIPTQENIRLKINEEDWDSWNFEGKENLENIKLMEAMFESETQGRVWISPGTLHIDFGGTLQVGKNYRENLFGFVKINE